ncbi:hypothetical protein D3C76_1337410 [compost metagenome]
MTNHGGELVIVQPGAAQALVVPRKAHWLDDMQTEPGIGAQADDIAGIRWNFWFE